MAYQTTRKEHVKNAPEGTQSHILSAFHAEKNLAARVDIKLLSDDRPVERVRKHAQDPYSATLGHTKTYGEPSVI